LGDPMDYVLPPPVEARMGSCGGHIVLGDARREALPTAWGTLARQCRLGDVAVARIIPDRLEGPVVQKTESKVHGAPEQPLRTELLDLA
jgi:hypothetical protein